MSPFWRRPFIFCLYRYTQKIVLYMFIDEIEIEVQAGDGGDGCIAFLREKYKPKGGPAGGDGGKGGDVWIEIDLGLLTLEDFHRKRIFKAKRGMNGLGKSMRGSDGQNITIKVPPGTMILDSETKELIADLDEQSEKVLIAKGGKGGLGNVHFASSVHQAPRKATKGESGEIKKLLLELRMIADIGIVGLPNAGKSSLVSLVSSAKPRKGDYPFTTLIPKIGHINLSDLYRVTIADLPGLIQDAHEGRGLGHRFLKHVQRTGALIHMIEWRDEFSTDSSEFLNDRNIILHEVSEFDRELLIKPRFTVLNKIDLIDPRNDKEKIFKSIADALNDEPFYPISIVTKYGIEKLIEDVSKLVLTMNGKIVDGLKVKFNLP